jgi:hypothetical protein
MIGGKAVAPKKALALLLDPDHAVNTVRQGVRIETNAATMAWLKGTAAGPFLTDDGEVDTSAMFGADDVAAAMIVGACVGFLVGLGLGIAATSGDSDTNGDDVEDDTGDDADEGGPE